MAVFHNFGNPSLQITDTPGTLTVLEFQLGKIERKLINGQDWPVFTA